MRHPGCAGKIGLAVEGNRADIWLTNPESNTIWLKLRILDEDGEILGETGLIRPSEYVQSVTFDTVPAPGATISMKVMAYEPETYHSGGAVTLNTVVQVDFRRLWPIPVMGKNCFC